jgi:hypothetical protein
MMKPASMHRIFVGTVLKALRRNDVGADAGAIA